MKKTVYETVWFMSLALIGMDKGFALILSSLLYVGMSRQILTFAGLFAAYFLGMAYTNRVKKIMPTHFKVKILVIYFIIQVFLMSLIIGEEFPLMAFLIAIPLSIGYGFVQYWFMSFGSKRYMEYLKRTKSKK